MENILHDGVTLEQLEIFNWECPFKSHVLEGYAYDELEERHPERMVLRYRVTNHENYPTNLADIFVMSHLHEMRPPSYTALSRKQQLRVMALMRNTQGVL